MNENIFETQYNVTKQSRLKKFYEKKKISIYSTIILLLICIGSVSYYLKNEENKKIILADKYMEAKLYIKKGNKDKAKSILSTIINDSNGIYSALSLFLILNENLVVDQIELSKLFDNVLKNNELEKEIENLIIYKKALFQSNFVSESELLSTLKPLINTETSWKPHVLLLLGDYFVSKKEYSKAKEFYIQILSLKNLHNEMYNIARSQIILIAND